MSLPPSPAVSAAARSGWYSLAPTRSGADSAHAHSIPSRFARVSRSSLPVRGCPCSFMLIIPACTHLVRLSFLLVPAAAPSKSSSTSDTLPGPSSSSSHYAPPYRSHLANRTWPKQQPRQISRRQLEWVRRCSSCHFKSILSGVFSFVSREIESFVTSATGGSAEVSVCYCLIIIF